MGNLVELFPKPVVLRVVDWNRARNELSFALDLEVQMLSEEAREFYMATTFVDRVDAYCDFLFVAIGSFSKLDAGQWNNYDQLAMASEVRGNLEAYCRQVTAGMLVILEQEWNIVVGRLSSGLPMFLSEAFTIVLEANENKGIERNAAGKVQKGPNYVKPEEAIGRLVNEYRSCN